MAIVVKQAFMSAFEFLQNTHMMMMFDDDVDFALKGDVFSQFPAHEQPGVEE